MKALISIHDVMPETLDRVQGILDIMPPACLNHLVLLVVPGKAWSQKQVAQLQAWQERGMELAGHGWQHEAQDIRGVYHRLHSLLLSRRAAEHLSLSAEQVAALIQRNHDWFRAQGLQEPNLYVPPAWALGRIPRDALNTLPFRYYESTRGYYDVQTQRSVTLPLCGFEADTQLRALSLRLWNRGQRLLASSGRPLRISLHPDDLQLYLSEDLKTLLSKVSESLDYRHCFPA